MRRNEAIDTIEAARSVEELRMLLDRVAQDYGFSGFNFIDAGSVYRDAPYWIGTADASWIDEYQSNDFAPDDPVIRHALSARKPFSWTDVTVPPRLGPRSRPRKVMDAAQDHGMHNGLVIPNHFRDDIGRTYSTCTCFFWKDPTAQYWKSFNENKDDLYIILMYWSNRVSELEHEEQRGYAYPVGLGGDKDAPLLTDREVDVLCWAAKGKTSHDIAEILGISSATVDTHFKSAIHKLEANSRAHAIVKALLLGMLPL